MKNLFLLVLLFSCQHSKIEVEGKIDHSPVIEKIEFPMTVGDITAPNGYLRPESSFAYANYLRALPLKPEGSRVKYFNGKEKPNRKVYDYVIDLPIGSKDLHQCADAIMRLKAEFHWYRKEYDKIAFRFTNGFEARYRKWREGFRIKVDGNRVAWTKTDHSSEDYASFWKYLETVFIYAGTASLEKELQSMQVKDAQPGDIMIQGGFPGHAVIIVDQCIDKSTGRKLFLLAQSYMPAQELQVLTNRFNPTISPWYELKEGEIKTSEWDFSSNDLMRFPD